MDGGSAVVIRTVATVKSPSWKASISVASAISIIQFRRKGYNLSIYSNMF